MWRLRGFPCVEDMQNCGNASLEDIILQRFTLNEERTEENRNEGNWDMEAKGEKKINREEVGMGENWEGMRGRKREHGKVWFRSWVNRVLEDRRFC